MKFISLAFAAVAMLASPVAAADLGGPKPATIVVQPEVKAPAFVKSPYAGAYIGAHVGRSWVLEESDFAGYNGGVQAGFNFDLGNGLLFGPEVDFSLSNANLSMTENDISLKLENDWVYSIRGRLGMEVAGMLPYVTAGIAYARFSGSESDGETTVSAVDVQRLWVVGAGIDYNLPSTNIILNAGVLHYWDADINDGMSQIRGGLNIKLN